MCVCVGLACCSGTGLHACSKLLLVQMLSNSTASLPWAVLNRHHLHGLTDVKWVGSGPGTGKLQGRSEELLGQFSREAPDRLPRPVHIATKLAPYPWRVTPGQFVLACR